MNYPTHNTSPNFNFYQNMQQFANNPNQQNQQNGSSAYPCGTFTSGVGDVFGSINDPMTTNQIFQSNLNVNQGGSVIPRMVNQSSTNNTSYPNNSYCNRYGENVLVTVNSGASNGKKTRPNNQSNSISQSSQSFPQQNNSGILNTLASFHSINHSNNVNSGTQCLPGSPPSPVSNQINATISTLSYAPPERIISYSTTLQRLFDIDPHLFKMTVALILQHSQNNDSSFSTQNHL